MLPELGREKCITRKCKYLRSGVARTGVCKTFIIEFARGLKDFETSVRGEKVSQCFSSNFQEMYATFETPAGPERAAGRLNELQD